MPLISEALWSTEFGDPMPQGMTYRDFAVIRKRKWIKEDIEWQLAHIKHLVGVANKLTGQQRRIVIERIGEERVVLGELYEDKIKFETKGINWAKYER